jgi:hypothetical protein
MLLNSALAKSSHKTKDSKYSKIAGILLIIYGIGVPLVLCLESLIVTTLDPETGLIAFILIPLLFIALWILPIIGGAFAIKRKHFIFTIISNVIALLYCVLNGGFILIAIYEQLNYESYLYLALNSLCILWLVLPVPSLILIMKSREDFI